MLHSYGPVIFQRYIVVGRRILSHIMQAMALKSDVNYLQYVVLYIKFTAGMLYTYVIFY